ncbi:axoneme-associated protein mst101(2) isoform X1 [Cololabis saira]|uniref:axoneme-associated protein mst101(2) isoform X1 n=1 Tax=Cololabis saira TaxID=129043 RepID=UPI002AD244FC|nr:axoneme-associated protein mst101(2) isoform X1 [Cololabis saira]
MSLVDQQWCPPSVQVTALQARGLRIKGKSGTNDAYAVIQVGKEKYQTSVVEKSVAPVWKEEATFDLPLLQQGGGGGGAERSTLRVHVLHRALVGPDKLLGQAVINLLQLCEDKTRLKTEWFKLLDKTGKPDKDRGEVLLDIQFMRNNMTASMFDLSAAGKSRSRLGKFKDKVRGKKKESDSTSSVQSFPQVITDSEEEGDGNAEGAAGKDGKSKKHKIKSLFSPKSNLQRNKSQSMSVLPAKNPSLSGSQSSGLNIESSEGKKFKFMIHKRSGSSGNKDSSLGHQKPVPAEQSNLCINGSHVYCEEPPPRTSRAGSNFSLASSGHGSVEDVPESSPPSVESLKAVRQYSPWMEEEEEEEDEEEVNGESIKEDVNESRREEQERNRMQEEMKNKEREEALKRQQEELELLTKEKMRQEEEAKRGEEERIMKEREREERVRREQEQRLAEEKRQEEQRAKVEEEKKRQREEEERIRREEEEERAQERQRQECKLAEERRLKEERELEEERRLEEQRKEEERRQKEAEVELMRKQEAEQKRQREEEERIRREEEEEKAQERQRQEERKLAEERKLKEEERKLEEERRLEEQRKEERRQKEAEVELMRKQEAEQKRQREEEERQRQEERKLAEERKLKEEEERKLEEEERRLEEQQREEERRQKDAEMELIRKQEAQQKRQKEEERIRREEEEEKAQERQRQEYKLAEERRLKEEEKKLEEERRLEEQQRKEEERRQKEAEMELIRKQEAEQKRQREEEERLNEEVRRQKEAERVRKEKEERDRLMEETRKLKEEEEKRRIEEEEKIRRGEEMIQEERRRNEENERIQRKEQERIRKEKRQEEDQRAIKEMEENEGVVEVRRLGGQEKRIEEEEIIKREGEQTRKPENKLETFTEGNEIENQKNEQRTAAKKSSVSSPGEVPPTHLFHENLSHQPSEDIPNFPSEPHNHTAKVEAVKQRCQSVVPSEGRDAVSSDQKDLVGTQREKRPAPLPPRLNQTERQRGKEQDVQVQHRLQSKDKDVKTDNCLPQCSVLITPMNKPPTGAKNTQSVPQNNTTKVTAKHTKRPAPSRPGSVGEQQPSSESKTSAKISHQGVTVAKQVHTVYGLNPFEDEDETELASDNDPSVSGPVCWPPPKSQSVDKDAASQVKVKSLKIAPAPPPPAKTDATSGTSVNQNGARRHSKGDTPGTGPNNRYDLQPENITYVDVHDGPKRQSQQIRVQTITVAGVKDEGRPTSPRRLQPVKPLNPLDQCASVQGGNDSKSTGHIIGSQDKTKVNDTGVIGPYSQLTKEELICLVLKQETKLLERNKKIAELEQYIDNLLVRVIEEQPSILMSLSPIKKAA